MPYCAHERIASTVPFVVTAKLILVFLALDFFPVVCYMRHLKATFVRFVSNLKRDLGIAIEE